MGKWRRRKPASVPNEEEGSVSKCRSFVKKIAAPAVSVGSYPSTWPDNKPRFRRRVQTQAIAKGLDLQIQAALANGSWPDLRRRLTEPPPKVVTIEEFSQVYFNEYCMVQNTRPDFKEHALKPIVRLLGHLRLDEITREHGHQYKKDRRPEVGANGTVNREFSVLHNMFAFAVDKGIISLNPLDRFKKLPEPQTVLQVMTLREERRLIDAVFAEDHLDGIFCGFLGETALRRTEGLRVQWPHIDQRQQLLTVDASKNFKIRHVRLSDYAMELLSQATRVFSSPYVFTRLGDSGPMKTPRAVLERAREKVNLGWVGFHDFRHFRASRWVMHGVDIRSVREMLGHADIQTTMRYAHFAPNNALRSVIEAEYQEKAELAAVTEAAGNK